MGRLEKKLDGEFLDSSSFSKACVADTEDETIFSYSNFLLFTQNAFSENGAIYYTDSPIVYWTELTKERTLFDNFARVHFTNDMIQETINSSNLSFGIEEENGYCFLLYKPEKADSFKSENLLCLSIDL